MKIFISTMHLYYGSPTKLRGQKFKKTKKRKRKKIIYISTMQLKILNIYIIKKIILFFKRHADGSCIYSEDIMKIYLHKHMMLIKKIYFKRVTKQLQIYKGINVKATEKKSLRIQK